MGLFDTRESRIGVVLVGIVAFTMFMLVNVLGTMFFAVTIAYVSLPMKRRLVDRGLPNRIATALLTTSVFVATVLLIAPVVMILYRRREELLVFLDRLPDEFLVDVPGFTQVVELEVVITLVKGILVAVALGFARTTPVLLAKVFLFTFVVYALLLRPEQVRRAVFGVVPDSHAGDLQAFHERIRDTLYGLYVVQAATAAGTFLVALAVFFLLGYRAFFALAVLAGVLQFVPILGPSIVVVGLAGLEYATGDPNAAVVVLVVGLVFIASLPDLIIRPRLAQGTTGLSPTLYFVGFIAGALSFGAVGVIAGPLVIAILVEAVEIASEHAGSVPDSAWAG